MGLLTIQKRLKGELLQIVWTYSYSLFSCISEFNMKLIVLFKGMKIALCVKLFSCNPWRLFWFLQGNLQGSRNPENKHMLKRIYLCMSCQLQPPHRCEVFPYLLIFHLSYICCFQASGNKSMSTVVSRARCILPVSERHWLFFSFEQSELNLFVFGLVTGVFEAVNSSAFSTQFEDFSWFDEIYFSVMFIR